MSSSAMALMLSSAVNHTLVHGHLQCQYLGNNVLAPQKQRSHLSLSPGFSSDKVKYRSSRKITICAGPDGNLQEDRGTDPRESSSVNAEGKEDNEVNGSGSSFPTPNPFIGGKISSRITARTARANNVVNSTSISTPPLSAEPLKAPLQENLKISPGPFTTGIPSLSAKEQLKSARPSVFTDAGAQFTAPVSKNLLNAIRKTDLGGKTTKFGQPVVPTNLFDEPKRSLADEKKFDFTLSRGQLIIIFSFLTIISIMFGTAFIVWKLGGIHYNEY